jgi:hypothetical protein
MPTEITGGRVLAGLVAWRFEVGHDGVQFLQPGLL